MTMQEPEYPKRFYEAVSLDTADGQWRLLLDGRAAKTPGRQALTASSEALANAMVREWSAQDTHIMFAAMPMTGYQMTVLDAAASEHDAWRVEINRFMASDLLCYRAESPVELVRRQNTIWDAALAALRAHFDITLKPVAGVMFLNQDPAALARAETVIATLDIPALLTARRLTELTGSAALGLLGAHMRMEEAAIIEAAQLDETFQAEKWGLDSEAQARRAQIATEISDAMRFRRLTGVHAKMATP
ncbi:MAG: ATP12 family protein [Pseudomonadota bacterium]